MKKFKVIVLFVAVGLTAGCTKSEGGEDSQAEVEDPRQEEQAAPEEQEEDAALDLAPELPLDIPSEVPEGPENCPPPPYGTQVGDIIQPHQFISVDNTLISLCDFHNDPSLKLLLIYATAGWCGVCHQESLALPGYYHDYHDQGFQILAAVFEDEGANPATRTYAQNYANRYSFPFPTVVDNTFQLGIYFDKAATPMNMFVDLTTMEILAIDLGFDYVTDSMRGDIEVYLSRITR